MGAQWTYETDLKNTNHDARRAGEGGRALRRGAGVGRAGHTPGEIEAGGEIERAGWRARLSISGMTHPKAIRRERERERERESWVGMPNEGGSEAAGRRLVVSRAPTFSRCKYLGSPSIGGGVRSRSLAARTVAAAAATGPSVRPSVRWRRL